MRLDPKRFSRICDRSYWCEGHLEEKKRGNVGFHGPQNNSNDVARPSFDAALKRFYKRKFKQMFLPYHHFRRSKVPGEGLRRVSRRLVGRGGRSGSRVSFRRQRFLRPPASKC